ncbi:putative PurR-regulated permease PerM [Orbus hercynius]|uniref:Putative PurR-regulated permease PerM n=1 Tax=Orbus hercynius TaxID=593135 RepID=A0A495RBM5_9GAMM|nr:AI-2E family transporter [Orbus hercynius]RKS84799.1 putative PurR-regulated permease PerM [Orbus hercynius]
MLHNDQQKIDIFCAIGFSIFFIVLMQIHLMSAVIAGLLTYTLTIKLDNFLSLKMTKFSDKSKLLSVLLLSTLILLIFIGGFWYLFTWFVDMARHPAQTMENIKTLLDKLSDTLPDSLRSHLPDSTDEIKNHLIIYLKEHVFYLQSMITRVFHVLIIIIIGMVIGLILGFKTNKRNIEDKQNTQTLLMQGLSHCLDRLVLVFQYVAISQVVIALFNAVMTAIFLFVLLPIFGIHLPFSKSLVLATFIFGLIPIVGNLVVNVLMFFVAFTVSFNVAIFVIVYLILIHKFEYVLNAKIVGTKIHAGICELLIAMLFFETLFGLIGLVFAPIFYAFIKLSLKETKLI